MAIQGLQGTGDFVPNERPLNWRQGILMRFPNGHAPLVALTSAMKKKVTDDPDFNWWEREVSNVRFELSGSITNVVTVIPLLGNPFGFGGALQIKKGDVLYVEESTELMFVLSDPTIATSLPSVERGYAGTTAAAITLGAGVNPNLVRVGSVFEEGSDTPSNVRYRPTQVNNFTQIFRNSLKATRTAMQTRLRTVEEVKDAKQQALLYHSIDMEYAMIFGSKIEETGANGELQRATGGIISFIPGANVRDLEGTTPGWDTIEDIFLDAFRFGSQEKIAFMGNRAVLAIQRIIRKANAVSVEMTPMTKEFGMDVRRLFTPYGTLILKTHPLFNQITSDTGVGDYDSFDTWMLIVDMANLTYRPLRNSDTQYLPDRQANGIDGLTSEYLTEAGLEIAHGKHHFLVKGLRQSAGEA